MDDETATLDDAVGVERRPPEVVFGLLADDTRVGILRALGETPDEACSFSALQERVGTPDSGRFNYHLRKLLGTFVRKTDDGYELTHAGKQIVGAMYAGTYTANATVDELPVDGACPLCGGDIVGRYAEESVRIECADCEEWYNEFPFPPGSLDQFDRDELPYAFDRWMRLVFERIVSGFCHTCAGRMDGRLVLDSPEDQLAEMPGHVEYECRRCGSTARSAAAMPTTLHPGVEGFLFEHGHDVRTDPTWRVQSAMDRVDVTVLAEDPPSLEIRLVHGDESVVAVVAADASVRNVRRVPADA